MPVIIFGQKLQGLTQQQSGNPASPGGRMRDDRRYSPCRPGTPIGRPNCETTNQPPSSDCCKMMRQLMIIKFYIRQPLTCIGIEFRPEIHYFAELGQANLCLKSRRCDNIAYHKFC